MKRCSHKLTLVTILSILSSMSAFGQSSYYETFNITGPTVVCADNSTIHTYTAGVEWGTWAIGGGTIVGTGTSTVTVRWNNLTGWLTCHKQEQSNCWWDDSDYPPVQYCDTYYYDSNPFNVAASNGGSVSGSTAACNSSSGTLTLSGHTGSVIRWEQNTSGSWTPISNTTTTLNYNVSAYTQFRAVLNNPCANYSSPATININPPTIGGIVNSVSLCAPSYQSDVTIYSNTGNVVQWETNTGSGWSAIPNSANLYSVPCNISIAEGSYSKSVQYRVLVQSGMCAAAYSSTGTITISGTSSGGTVSNAAPCINSSGSMQLSGSIGSILRWEQNIGSGWTNIANTTTTQPYTNITVTTQYRALVQNGACAALYSNVGTATVSPQPIGGTISGGTSFCSGPGSGTLTLNGYTGSVLYWEKNTGSGWTTIVNSFIPTHAYSGVTVSTQYRATVRSGWCADVISSTATITINPPSVGGTLSGGTTACASASGTLTLSGYTGSIIRWEKNTGSGWTNIANTTITESYSGVTITTQYRAWIVSGVCTGAYSSTATITINPVTVGGTVSGSATACASSSGTLTLSGHVGSVQRWEYNDGGGWITISNTASTQNYNLSSPIARQYRAVVKSGLCSETNSSSATITIHPATVAGNIIGAGTVCSPSNGTLTLQNYTGNIVRWEYNDPVVPTAFTSISNATATQTYTGIGATTQYRAIVKSGVCAEVSTLGAVIYVDTPPLGGTVTASADVYANLAEGELTLSGHNGNIVRWESIVGGQWSGISGTSTAVNYDYSTTQSNSYRAVIKNGVCPEVGSAPANINLYPATVISPPGSLVINYGNSVQLSANGPYYSYQWYRNSTPINGATSQQYTAVEPGDYFVQVRGTSTASLNNSPASKVKSLLVGYEDEVNAVSTTVILTKDVPENQSIYLLPTDSYAQSISYQDGLGRTFQSVGVGMSPQGGDIISPAGYSRNGLIDSAFLPYTIATKEGRYRINALRGNASYTSYNTSEQYQFYQNTSKVSQDMYPYSRTAYRNTPDAKMIEQGAPGAEWQLGTTHTVRNTVALNNASTHRVRYWKPDGFTTGDYPDNSVIVSITTDENNNLVRTFTNALGQTVLKQVQIDETLEGIATTWLETYYVYDEFGRLIYIIPPKAMKVLGAGWSLYAGHATINELVYRYQYDDRSRLIEKKEPGTVWQYFIYDVYDRLVLMQNADTRAASKWLYIKYDSRGRAVSRGLYSNNRTRTSVQNWANKAYTTNPSYAAQNYVEDRFNDPGNHGYTNQSFPKDSIQYMSVNYYDDYDFDFNGTADYSYLNNHLTNQESTNLTRVRGMATGNKSAVIDETGTVTNNWLISVAFYDESGRVIQIRNNNLMSTEANNLVTAVYDFPGRIVKTKSSSSANRITWQNLVAAQAETDRLSCTSGAGAWGTSGASSVQQIPAGTDGWVQTTVTETSSNRMFGFSSSDPDPNYTSINYAFYLAASTLKVYENGVFMGNLPGGEAVGDILRIERTGTTVRYYRNGILVYTAVTPSSSALMADVAFHTLGATIGYTQISTGQATTLNTTQRYTYDQTGRPLSIYHAIESNSEQLVVAYEYNALGQLVDKKLHNTGGSNFLQSIDYRYSIRGWLKSINNAQLSVDTDNDEISDLFGMEVVYNNSESGLSNTLYHNGNISALKWKGPGQQSGAADQRSYKYTYDKSDRLRTAAFQARGDNAWDIESGTLNESLTYDHNGNIKSLQRNQNQRGLSGTAVTSTPQTIDDLTYTYAFNRNRLTKVEDATANIIGFKNGVNTTTEYTYSTGGSITKDDNKGISSIIYNVIGKPRYIAFSDGRTIEYVYDASGNKLKMKTTVASQVSVTEYESNLVYENGVLSYFSSPEGRVVKNGNDYDYQYAISDHQGNTRVVFSSATPPVQTYTANMEDSTNTAFENYPTGGNRSGLELYDHTDFSGSTYTRSQLLNGGNNSQVGVAKSFKLYPGDKVKIEAYAKFFNPQSSPGNLGAFAGALLNAFSLAPPAGGEVGTASAGVNQGGNIIAAGGGKTPNGFPGGYVNILVLDKNYNFLDLAYQQMDGGEQTGATPKYAHDLMEREYTAREEGYVYLFVSNESPTLVDIYFDDVVITHTKSNVIQYNEYYPFGMQTAQSWTRENVTGNNFLANGGTELNKTSNLYDLDFRNYDPVLGRMYGVDPMASKYASLSPYNFSFNDPVTFTDPSGADPDNPGDWDYTGGYTELYNSGQWSPVMDPGYGNYGSAGAGMYTNYGSPALAASNVSNHLQMSRDANVMGQAEYGRKYGTTYGNPQPYGAGPSSVNPSGSYAMSEIGKPGNPDKPWHSFFTSKTYVSDFLYEANKYNPVAIIGESISVYATGHDTYGVEVSKTEATVSLATVIPIGRVAGTGSQLLNQGLKLATRGWKVGMPITALTAKGNVPAWSTVRQRFWKNEALLNSSIYEEFNVLRMQKGLAPQFQNVKTGLMESMELHHTIPQRDGGLFEFIKVTPEQHRLLDPFRR